MKPIRFLAFGWEFSPDGSKRVSILSPERKRELIRKMGKGNVEPDPFKH